ncbi:MAG: pyridoxal 5'-phosphate synthase, partial [Pirellula sp.]
MTIHHLRRNYTFGSLSRSDLPVEPIQLFKDWFAQLHATELPDWFEVNAMTLSTSNLAAGVSSRIVLLKHLDEDGFLFFTNYDSSKGRQIAIDPHVAIHFYWPIFDRQVRIEGKATKTSAEISNNYFESRPRTSQLGAVVSPQSEIISDDAQLARDMDELDKIYGGQSIP